MNEIIGRFAGKRILVIGDLMLDCYLEGEVSHISPEAPVPVIRAQAERIVPGGAANSANNCARMGATVHLVGVIGADQAGRQLTNLLKEAGIDTRSIIVDKSRPTTTKTRIITRQQQMMRIDVEHQQSFSRHVQDELLAIIDGRIKESDAVIISDYAKGTLTEELSKSVIQQANLLNIPIVVDPKPENIMFFKGATLIKPNLSGAARIVGHPLTSQDEVLRAGAEMIRKLSSSILITQGEKGMTLFEKTGQVTTIPTQAKDVYDVSGAGDTVASIMAISLAVGAEMREAAILANHAAGIVVAKVGTATLSPEELSAVLERESTKTKTLPELVRIVSELRRKGKRIVWTNGCFDILHVGHTRYLTEARKLGDVLILGLNTDDSVRRLKGAGRPILPEQERAEVLGALACIDYIIFFEEDTPIIQLKAIMPDIIVKGGDYRKETVVGADLMDQSGGRVEIIPLVQGYSTTALIDRIRGKA